MSDAPKMGFLAALQKGKTGNEQEAKASETKPNPVSESRPNPLLFALGKATQKADESPVATSPSKDQGATSTVENPGLANTVVQASVAEDKKDSSGIGNQGVVEAPKSGGIFAKPAAGDVSGENGGAATGTGTGIVTSPQNRILAAAVAAKEAPPVQSYDHLFDQIPEKFEDVLTRFDELLTRDQGVNDLNIGHLRDYVKRIFNDLTTNPEYDGLVIDRDVHNVIKWIRAVKTQATELAVDKKTKAAKAEVNKTKKNRFAAISGNLDIGGKMPTSIQDMSSIGDLDLDLGLGDLE